MLSKKSASLESVEMTLRHFAENGGFNFTIYYAGVGILQAKIDDTWEILSVVSNSKTLSFVASQAEQPPVEYSIQTAEPLKKIQAWFEETALTLQPGKVISKKGGIHVPKNLVFTLRNKEFPARKSPVT